MRNGKTRKDQLLLGSEHIGLRLLLLLHRFTSTKEADVPSEPALDTAERLTYLGGWIAAIGLLVDQTISKFER